MLSIEVVRQEDVTGVARLALASLRERYDSEWLAHHAHVQQGTFLVARDIPTNQVVGFALAERDQGAESHLLALAVESGRRNQGIGSALLRGVRENLARSGTMCLKLDVRADDVKARQFYERH